MADEPVVAVPRRLVAGHVGADAMDVDIVGTAFGNNEKGLLTRLRLGRRPTAGAGTAAAAAAVTDLRKSRRFIKASQD